jgi:hypothetical protein
MTNDSLNVVIVIIVITIVFFLIFVVDKRVTKHGSLFTKKPSAWIRVITIIVGAIFIGYFGLQYYFLNSTSPLFAILGVALVGYGLGSFFLIDELQSQKQKGLKSTIPPLPEDPPVIRLDRTKAQSYPETRIIRFLKIFTPILIASSILILASFWASAHKENPLSQVVVIGVIVLYLFFLLGGHVINIIRISRKK